MQWLAIAVDLRGANLCGADLRNVKFDGTIFGDTNFGNTNLTDAKNLELCIHRRPSTVDHRTFLNSNNLPIEFLRGCGLPDNIIEYYKSLLGMPLQFYSCFISYSHKDEDFTQRLYADLQDNGLRCWYSPEDIKIGDKIRLSIDVAIEKHEKLLLILSEYSINSQWVEQEVEKAFEQEREENRLVLFPIRLDNAVLKAKGGWASYLKNTRNIGDFSQWKDHSSYKKAFDRLLRDLKKDGKE
jgi:hypothetical protein